MNNIFETRFSKICELQSNRFSFLYLICKNYSIAQTTSISRNSNEKNTLPLRNAILSLAKKHKFSSFEDWYSFKKEHFIEEKILSSSDIQHYQLKIMKLFPDYEWKPWKFAVIPKNWWLDKTKHREFMDWVGKELGIKHWEDWYNISNEKLKAHKGRSMLAYYGDSISKILLCVYPEHPWELWRFGRSPKQFWDDLKHQRKFFEYANKQLNIKNLDDWYQIPKKKIDELGGISLLTLNYGGSVYRALKAIFPEHQWKWWKFTQIPRNCITNKEHLSEFIEFAEEKLQIQKKEDWCDVTLTQLRSLGLAHSCFMQNIREVLSLRYPGFELERTKFKGNPNKVELSLFRMIKKLAGETKDVYLRYPHPTLKYEETEEHMEFDIFVPHLQLAIEYHGKQHYKEQQVMQGIDDIQRKDNEKKLKCKRYGVKLIVIPYTWDQSMDGLKSIIKEQNPSSLLLTEN